MKLMRNNTLINIAAVSWKNYVHHIIVDTTPTFAENIASLLQNILGHRKN